MANEIQISRALPLSSRSNPRSIDLPGDNSFTDLALPQDVPCMVALSGVQGADGAAPGAIITSDIVVYITTDNSTTGRGIPLIMDASVHSGRLRVNVTRRAGATVYVNHHTSVDATLNVLELR